MPETVVMHRGHGLPYSKGLMSQTLSATGLSPQRSFDLARQIEDRLTERGEPEVDLAGLRALAEEVLLEAEGEAAVRRFRDWNRLDRLDRPLIVMVGGAAGRWQVHAGNHARPPPRHHQGDRHRRDPSGAAGILHS